MPGIFAAPDSASSGPSLKRSGEYVPAAVVLVVMAALVVVGRARIQQQEEEALRAAQEYDRRRRGMSPTGGLLLVPVLSASARAEKVPGSLSSLIFIVTVVIGRISWFAGRPKGSDPKAPGEETRCDSSHPRLPGEAKGRRGILGEDPSTPTPRSLWALSGLTEKLRAGGYQRNQYWLRRLCSTYSRLAADCVAVEVLRRALEQVGMARLRGLLSALLPPSWTRPVRLLTDKIGHTAGRAYIGSPWPERGHPYSGQLKRSGLNDRPQRGGDSSSELEEASA